MARYNSNKDIETAFPRGNEPLSDLLTKWLQHNKLYDTVYQHRLLDIYPSVVGPTITSRTQSIYIKHGILYLKIESAPLRSELSSKRTALIAKLNAAIGAATPIVTDIAFM